MFPCNICGKTFTMIKNLHRHANSHDDSKKISCSFCSEIFTRKDNLIRHSKDKHRSNIVVQQQPTITKQEIQDFLTPAEHIYDYNVQSRNGHKRPYHTENSNEAANAKKTRMSIVKTRGFIKTGTSLSNKIKWYYVKNTDNLTNYRTFLESTKKDLIELLKLLSTKQPIKYNLKLEATYDRPNVENSAENRAFKTSAKEMFMDTDIEAKINQDFANLLLEEEIYTSKGSGFTLQSIDGLLLGVYNYTPMGGSSYIPLPNYIKNKKAVINPQNSDQQCFKWAILARHVSGNAKNQVAENYTSLEDKYNFSGLTFPTLVREIKIFEKNNPKISVNIYGLKKEKNFEKDFFKLLNNAVFGKTMESLRKHFKMELVSCPKRLQKLINKQTFKHCTTYSENLAAVSLEHKIIMFNKPIYIGFAVLDISKTMMYDYHFNVMKAHYGDNINLMYTDTDSLIYHIKTDDFYKDLPIDHPCYIAERKKIPGLFSDEAKGQPITKFIALRAKSYAYILNDKEKIKAKGVRGHVVKNHMTFDHHFDCLFADDEKENSKLYTRENVSTRSFNHKVRTIKSQKICFNRQDDKRIAQPIEYIPTLMDILNSIVNCV